MKQEYREQIEGILEASKKDFERLHGQKRQLRQALYDIRKALSTSVDYAGYDDVEEIIRATLVRTFG